MKVRCTVLLPTIIMTVQIPVSRADGGKVDANNIFGVILRITDDRFYKTETKKIILTSFYARNQIFECEEL